MFSRVKELASKKPRQLITSCMFGAYIALAATNVIVNRDALSAVDIGILVPALATLGTAIIHSLVRAAHAVAQDADEEDQKNAEAQQQNLLCITNSSHNMINAALHITSSSCFVAFDALLLAGVTTIPASTPLNAAIVRLAGSSSWSLASWMNLFTAIAQDRKQENNPDQKIRALGITPQGYTLTNEILYLATALCFAYALYSENPINPFKASANSLWLLAATIGTSAAVYDFAHRNDNDTITPAVNTNDVVIELSDLSESSSSEIIAKRPMM